MKLQWARMKKDQRATYLEHRDEQREIAREMAYAPAKASEALRKAVVASLEANGSMVVKSLELEYVPGRPHRWNRGRWEHAVASQFVLIVEALGQKLELRIGWTFQCHLGRLSEKLRNLIRQAMPASIELVPGFDFSNGDSLVLLSFQTVSRWVEVVETLRTGMPEKASA